MAKRKKLRRRVHKLIKRLTRRPARTKNKIPYKRKIKSGVTIKRPRAISKARLGHGLRVLTDTGDLKTAARGGKTRLTKDIASTQRMVEKSIQSINRLVRELNLVHA